MKIVFMASTLILCTPLAAQSFEAGLFVGQQQYHSANQYTTWGTANRAWSIPDNKIVYAVRLGYTVVDFGPAAFQVTAGYQPESKSSIKIAIPGIPDSYIGNFKESHLSAGAMFNYKAPLAIGAGLEFRSEKLGWVDYPNSPGTSTTYNRIWARFNANYAIPGPVAKPFVGVEVALPLSSANENMPMNSTPADILKAMAPKAQLGIFAGIRF